MDKITLQIRAKHWARLLNECIWYRANDISEKQFFYWQRILCRESYEVSQNPPLPTVAETEPLSTVQRTVSFVEIKLPAILPDASPVFRPNLVSQKVNLVLEISMFIVK